MLSSIFIDQPRLSIVISLVITIAGTIGPALRHAVPSATTPRSMCWEVETALRRAGKGYVLGVNGSHPFNSDRTSESDGLLS